MTSSRFRAESPDEADLLQRIRAGDRSAAEEIAEGHYRRIYRYACRLTGDLDAAADLCQETFRKAWSSLHSFDGRAAIATWLHRIAYTTFLNSIRGPKRLVPIEVDDPPLPDPSPSADERIGQDEDERALRRAVLELSEELRFTVTAHYWGEMTVREIAAVEQITTVAVRKRLVKALARLESRLSEVKR